MLFMLKNYSKFKHDYDRIPEQKRKLYEIILVVGFSSTLIVLVSGIGFIKYLIALIIIKITIKTINKGFVYPYLLKSKYRKINYKKTILNICTQNKKGVQRHV